MIDKNSRHNSFSARHIFSLSTALYFRFYDNKSLVPCEILRQATANQCSSQSHVKFTCQATSAQETQGIVGAGLHDFLKSLCSSTRVLFGSAVHVLSVRQLASCSFNNCFLRALPVTACFHCFI